MKLDRRICDRARLSRDPRFDGLFFFGVHSTGIYCRPVCPAPPPKPEHINYYPAAGAAAEAGLRPCLRCRPEAAPGSPVWNGGSEVVSRAMRLIRQGALNEGGIEELAQQLGVDSRQLRRLFQAQIGVSPKTMATTQKTLFARKLLTETRLPVTEIAFASGFGSVRRFNSAFSKAFGTSPSALRRPPIGAETKSTPFVQCTFTLSYRPPFDWENMLDFFRKRAIPGVEWVDREVYRRSIRLKETFGSISIAPACTGHALQLRTFLSDSRDLLELVERVRRLFDLDANMGAIHEVLETDPDLKTLLEAKPGLRLPGGWDPFEIAVRAVVGQQISIQGARTVMGRIADRAGPAVESPACSQLTRFFPRADELCQCDLEEVGLITGRRKALLKLARDVASGEIELAAKGRSEELMTRLTSIPGIGDWTAQYIAMRALGEPDAFPASDLGLRRALQQGGFRPTPKEIQKRAENWRPWRAYAAIALWNT